MNKLIIATSLCLSLSAQSAWAQINIHATSTSTPNPKATLANLKKNPNTPVSLTQALAILKDPALCDANGTLKESSTIQLDAGTNCLGELLNINADSSGDADQPVTIEGPKDANAIISVGRAGSGFTPVTVRAASVAQTEQLQWHSNGGTSQGVTSRELAETSLHTTCFQCELLIDISKPDGTPRKLLGVANLPGMEWSTQVGLATSHKQNNEIS